MKNKIFICSLNFKIGSFFWSFRHFKNFISIMLICTIPSEAISSSHFTMNCRTVLKPREIMVLNAFSLFDCDFYGFRPIFRVDFCWSKSPLCGVKIRCVSMWFEVAPMWIDVENYITGFCAAFISVLQKKSAAFSGKISSRPLPIDFCKVKQDFFNISPKRNCISFHSNHLRSSRGLFSALKNPKSILNNNRFRSGASVILPNKK